MINQSAKKMSDYPLDKIGRYALFTIHQQKCWLCYETLLLGDMEIDHILPDNLQKNVAELDKALEEFGLPSNFDLNSLDNLLPSHARCNNQKRKHVFRATPLIQFWLDQAASKAQCVRDLRMKYITDQELEKAIATVESRKGDLTLEQIDRLAMPYASANSTSVLVVDTGTVDSKGNDIMTYTIGESFHKYVPPKKFLVTSDTGVVFDQEPRESRDAIFRYHIERNKNSEE